MKASLGESRFSATPAPSADLVLTAFIQSPQASGPLNPWGNRCLLGISPAYVTKINSIILLERVCFFIKRKSFTTRQQVDSVQTKTLVISSQ